MSETEKKPPPEGEEFSRFQKIARALFRVDKRDVPKHEPKKRLKDIAALQDDPNSLPRP